MKKCLAILVLSSLISTVSGKSYGPFDGIKRITATPPQGNWSITKSIDNRVYLDLETDYDGASPEFSVIQQGDSLTIRLSSHPGSIHGKIPRWTLRVPNKIFISIHMGKGSVEASGVETQLDAMTGNGDFMLRDLVGDIKASTSSGSMDAVGIRGTLHLTVSKGTLKSSRVSLAGASSLSASGDCSLSISAALKGDLEVKSVNGDAVVRFNGFPVEGQLTMQSGKGGSIRSPFKFEKTSEFREPGNNEQWEEKSVQLGKLNFRIRVSTARGIAEVVR